MSLFAALLHEQPLVRLSAQNCCVELVLLVSSRFLPRWLYSLASILLATFPIVRPCTIIENTTTK
jgi:hypothetical protein